MMMYTAISHSPKEHVWRQTAGCKKHNMHSDVSVLQSRNNKRFHIVQTKILTMERMRNTVCSKTLKICSEKLKSKIGNFQCHLQTGPFNVAFHICADHMTYLWYFWVFRRYYQLIMVVISSSVPIQTVLPDIPHWKTRGITNSPDLFLIKHRHHTVIL